MTCTTALTVDTEYSPPGEGLRSSRLTARKEGEAEGKKVQLSLHYGSICKEKEGSKEE